MAPHTQDRSWNVRWITSGLLLASLAMVLLFEGRGIRRAENIEGPTVSAALAGHASAGDVRRLPSVERAQPALIPFDPDVAPGPAPHAGGDASVRSEPLQIITTDPALQKSTAAQAMPAPQVNFKGLSRPLWGNNLFPPDPTGDVGPFHYIQAVKTAVGIFDKTGAQLAAFTFDAFFSSNGGTGTVCDTNNLGDPNVLYDAQADRWVVSDFAWATTAGPFYECIAVSKTSDPLGAWWLYPLVVDANLIGDYPKMSVWADGYYMSANMFQPNPYQKVRTRVWALDRASMLTGTQRSVSFDLLCSPTCYSTLLPSNFKGTPPPAGSPAIYAAVQAPSTLHLWRFHVDWTKPENSTFTGPVDVTVATFADYTNKIPAQDGQGLNTLGGELMMQAQYRNINGMQSLWLNHTVTSGAYAGVRWYQVRNPNGTPGVYQQGTYQPDPNYRWMGSLAVDAVGNMAIGYSTSNINLYPSIRYAGRLATDAPSTLGQGETTLIAGTGSQTGNGAWGDYSTMSVDPTDDCTFWYTNEYFETIHTADWQTRIGSFKFPSCEPGVTPTATSTATATSSPTATATARPSSTPTATGTMTPTDTATPTATSTMTPTDTATPTATSTPSRTPTGTPTLPRTQNGMTFFVPFVLNSY